MRLILRTSIHVINWQRKIYKSHRAPMSARARLATTQKRVLYHENRNSCGKTVTTTFRLAQSPKYVSFGGLRARIPSLKPRSPNYGRTSIHLEFHNGSLERISVYVLAWRHEENEREHPSNSNDTALHRAVQKKKVNWKGREELCGATKKIYKRENW